MAEAASMALLKPSLASCVVKESEDNISLASRIKASKAA